MTDSFVRFSRNLDFLGTYYEIFQLKNLMKIRLVKYAERQTDGQT